MQIGRRKLLGGLAGVVGAALVGKTASVAKANPSLDTTEFEQKLDWMQQSLKDLKEGKSVALPTSVTVTDHSYPSLNREYISGLLDPGELRFDMDFYPTDYRTVQLLPKGKSANFGVD